MARSKDKVVPARNTHEDGRDSGMAAAGARFERYVREAMGASGMTLADLSRASGIAETNWHGWFRGDHQPRRNTLLLAGQALERTPEQLLSVWDGGKPHKPRKSTETPDELVSALQAQTAEMARLTEELARGRVDQQEATDALLRAMAALVPRREGTSTDSERDVPVDTPR